MRSIAPTGPEMLTANENDFLRIHLKNGSIYEDTFKSISNDSISTISKTFSISDIKFIEKEEIDGLKTSGAIVGGTVGLLALGALIIVVSFLVMVNNAVT